MKRLLLILIICHSSLSAHAQHFDWVKSYIGESDCDGLIDLNTIVGSAVDNEGNNGNSASSSGERRADENNASHFTIKNVTHNAAFTMPSGCFRIMFFVVWQF